MLIICSWCKKKLGEKEPLEDKRKTHSICNECYEKLTKKKVIRGWDKNHPDDSLLLPKKKIIVRYYRLVFFHKRYLPRQKHNSSWAWGRG